MRYEGEILFNIRNNWVGEKNFWDGRWGRDSAEWTEEAKKEIDPNFFDLPNFWMSF